MKWKGVILVTSAWEDDSRKCYRLWQDGWKTPVVFSQVKLPIFQYFQTKNTVGRVSLDYCILQLAKLGGYLARATDPPPGTFVIWPGLSRLTDIQLGFSLFAKSCE